MIRFFKTVFLQKTEQGSFFHLNKHRIADIQITYISFMFKEGFIT